MGYSKEQPDLSDDLEPDFQDRYDIDFFFSEFPYWQYKSANHEDVWWRLSQERGYWDIPDRALREGPYRTDLVGVSVNDEFLNTRVQLQEENSEIENPPLSLNRGSGFQNRARRYLRCYADFLVDGPMTREEYVHDYPSYGPDSARRAFTWIKRRGWLVEMGDEKYRAASMPVPITGGVHAIEIKINSGEWKRAVEQVLRADFYADYLWVAYDNENIQKAIDNIGVFEEHGIGLIGVSPETVEFHLEAEKDIPPIDDDHLRRWATERLDLNERVLVRI